MTLRPRPDPSLTASSVRKAEDPASRHPQVGPVADDETYFDTAFGEKVWRVRLGGCRIGRGDEVLTTLLGSCIAVCVYDSRRAIGGMTHFLMPSPSVEDTHRFPDLAHGEFPFGEDAIRALVNEISAMGGGLDRMEAKVFGGADVMSVLSSVGQRNIACALSVLTDLQIPVRARDVGGTVSRRVYFQPINGRVWVHRNAVEGERSKGGEARKSVVAEKRRRVWPGADPSGIGKQTHTGRTCEGPEDRP